MDSDGEEYERDTGIWVETEMIYLRRGVDEMQHTDRTPQPARPLKAKFMQSSPEDDRVAKLTLLMFREECKVINVEEVTEQSNAIILVLSMPSQLSILV